MSGSLNYTFNICIIIGFVIPLLNLITGWFGSFFSAGIDLDLDASADFNLDVSADISLDASADFSVDAGIDTEVGSGGVIPFNIMCLCLSLVVFGALGHMIKRFMTTPMLVVLLLLVCLFFAGLSYWALYTLVIKRLKQNDASALAYVDLKGKSAEVTLRISSDSIGTISLPDSTGAPISFRAKMDPDLKAQMSGAIAQGESVIITDVDKEHKLCYVSVPVRNFQNKDS